MKAWIALNAKNNDDPLWRERLLVLSSYDEITLYEDTSKIWWCLSFQLKKLARGLYDGFKQFVESRNVEDAPSDLAYMDVIS